MVDVGASETKAVAALTLDGRDNLVQVLLLDTAFNDVRTVRSRAPPKYVLVLDVGAVEQLAIAVGEIGRDKQIERTRVEDCRRQASRPTLLAPKLVPCIFLTRCSFLEPSAPNGPCGSDSSSSPSQ